MKRDSLFCGVKSLEMLNEGQVEKVFLCGPLRISAFSALKSYFNAEVAEVRRGPQRKLKLARFIWD